MSIVKEAFKGTKNVCQAYKKKHNMMEEGYFTVVLFTVQ